MNVFVTLAAAFQFASPAWLATMLTRPVPVKERFVPPIIIAGPPFVVNVTNKPLEAVALNPAVFVTV